MSILKKIIISVSSVSLGVVVIAYFTGDKNKSVKENVQDNLHLVKQSIDESKEKVQRLFEKEETFIFSYPTYTFVLNLLTSIFFLIVEAYYEYKPENNKNFILIYHREKYSMISSLSLIIKQRTKTILEEKKLKCLRDVLKTMFFSFMFGEGLINFVIYMITYLIRNKTFKNMFQRHIFSKRFWSQSLINFIIFFVYSLVISIILNLFIGITCILHIFSIFKVDADEKKKIIESQTLNYKN